MAKHQESILSKVEANEHFLNRPATAVAPHTIRTVPQSSSGERSTEPSLVEPWNVTFSENRTIDLEVK
jgi:hypothetical protein